MADDTGKRGLGQKLKDKLHIGHTHKTSAASDDTNYGSQGQARPVLIAAGSNPSCQL